MIVRYLSSSGFGEIIENKRISNKLFFKNNCILCSEKPDDNLHYMCYNCHKNLKDNGKLKKFNDIYYLWNYDKKLRKIIEEYKFKNKLFMGELLFDLIGVELDELIKNGGYHVIRGFYDEILEYILSKFSRDNLYIGISEEINKNKQKYYNEIYKFLGTTKLIKINDTLNTHVREYTKKIPKKLEKYLYNIYKPHNEKLYD